MPDLAQFALARALAGYRETKLLSYIRRTGGLQRRLFMRDSSFAVILCAWKRGEPGTGPGSHPDKTEKRCRTTNRNADDRSNQDFGSDSFIDGFRNGFSAENIGLYRCRYEDRLQVSQYFPTLRPPRRLCAPRPALRNHESSHYRALCRFAPGRNNHPQPAQDTREHHRMPVRTFHHPNALSRPVPTGLNWHSEPISSHQRTQREPRQLSTSRTCIVSLEFQIY